MSHQNLLHKSVTRPCLCLLVLFLLTSTVNAFAVEEQKTIEVSTALEFQEAVGNFTTIILTKDIIIPWEDTDDGGQNGILVENAHGLVIEANGFTIDGDAENSVPQGEIGPPAITVVGGDISINSLTVTNFGCFGGAITLKEGVKALVTNSLVTKNLYQQDCSGISVFDGNADLPGYHPSHVTLNNVTMDDNYAYTGGGIAAVGQYRGTPRTTLTMVDCKVTNNKASYEGGGLYANGADVFLEGVLFENNVMVDGRKSLDNDVFLNNNAGCHDCWSSSIDIQPCPEGEFESVDEGKISVAFYPDSSSAPKNQRSYSCIPK